MIRDNNLLKSIIENAINRNDVQSIVEEFNHWNISELAEILQNCPEYSVEIIKFLVIHKAAIVFKLLNVSLQRDIIKSLPYEKTAQLLNEISVNDRFAFLEELPEVLVKKMIKYFNPQEKQRTLCLLGYPQESVGRLMIPGYITISDRWIVQEVLNYIRKKVKNSEMIEIIYVVNRQGQLIDDIRIREIILVDPSTSVIDLMDGCYVSLSITNTEEEAAKIFRRENRIALPVVDDQNTLLGVVSMYDILRTVNENYNEDVQKMGGMEVLDQPYLKVPFFKLVKKRAGCLILLFLGEMFTATAMQHFSNVLEKVLVLAMFIPLVVSSGGNSGSQAATLVIQAMALGEIRLRDWWRIMKRELICGLALGCTLGTVGFTRIVLWQETGLYDYGNHWFLVACTVAFSLIWVVLWGTFSGSMLPIMIKRLGGDPASSSAPFVATIVDVTGIAIYFSSAYIFLKGVLL